MTAELRNLLLNLDTLNVKSLNAKVIEAGTITADKMDVDQLSAISANLGTITAGLMTAVTIIGSYIATSSGTYPRAEMSTTDKSFTVYKDADDYIQINSDYAGSPVINIFEGGIIRCQIFSSSNIPTVQGTGGLILSTASGDIQLKPAVSGGRVTLTSWAKLYNTSTSSTLQDALNAKANAFFGYSGTFATGDGKTATVSNGIITSVV